MARRPEEVYERVVDVHVANLRRKLGDDAGNPWLIENGAGQRVSPRGEAGCRPVMRGRPLALRLAVLLAAVVVVVLLAAGWVVNRAASRSLDEQIGPRDEQRLSSRSRSSRRQWRAARPAGRSSSALNQIGRHAGGVVRITDGSGAVIAQGGRLPPERARPRR